MDDLSAEEGRIRRQDDGTFAVPYDEGREVGCDPSAEPCAPDDTDADLTPGAGPGTPDDLPLSLGEDVFAPADMNVIPGPVIQRGPAADERVVSRSAESPEDADKDLGRLDERELWRAQADLIEEDEQGGYKLPGFSAEQVDAVAAALGDDAADPIPDSATGTSATGFNSPLEPDHGGFPEREE